MNHDHDHDHDHDHEDDETCCQEGGLDVGDLEQFLSQELDNQSQIFLEMRGQNIELLKVAAQIAGFSGSHSPLKPSDLRQAVKSIFDTYAQMYEWVDPEVIESDEDDDEDDDE